MRERPILFSAPMVRAILEGRKSQTRRIVKPQPEHRENAGLCWKGVAYGITTDRQPYVREFLKHCPYGAPGDRLFIKETWRTAVDLDRFSPAQIAERCIDAGYPRPWAPLRYEADGNEVNRFGLRDMGDAWGKSRVSIHMPRWASRITLEVTGVRVERLHAITEEDAKAEGVEPFVHPSGVTSYRDGFARLWSEINETFDEDRWVWVVEFRRVEAQGRAA